MTVTISVEGLRLHAHHGVMEQERVVGNEFEVTVRLRYPALHAVETDSLDATINYAEVCDVIKEQMQQPSQLLEHVAGRIRKALLSRFPRIEDGHISITKLSPPITCVQLDGVSVCLDW